MKFSATDHSVPNLGGLLLENANILKGEVNMITSPRKRSKRST